MTWSLTLDKCVEAGRPDRRGRARADQYVACSHFRYQNRGRSRKISKYLPLRPLTSSRVVSVSLRTGRDACNCTEDPISLSFFFLITIFII